MSVGLAEAYKRGEVEFCDGGLLVWPSEKLLKLWLADRISKLTEMAQLSEASVSILTAAKEGRNFLAHQVAEPLFFFNPRREIEILDALPKMFREVRNIAVGDNLVSCWEYQICENEPAPYSKGYAHDVSRWVFSEFDTELCDFDQLWRESL